MAYENVQFPYPNFCLGPQTGTFCSIDNSEVTTKLLIKNDTGALLNSFSLSSNIINEVVGLEYVGPPDLSALIDNLTFFTVEKVSVSSVIIKRWETRISNLTLNLKQQKIKSSSGNYYYDISSACVESYNRGFSAHNQGGINYLEMSSVSRVVPGTRLFLGPSTDADNIGAVETVIVSHVSEGKVYVLSNLAYQYLIGDNISFYNNIYLFSNVGYAGDADKGSLFQINLYTGNVSNVVFDGIYKRVVASRWSPLMSSIGAVLGANLLFINPYNYFSNERSLNINNIEDDKITLIDMGDIVFREGSVYKLMDKMTLREDDGSESTEEWTSYNYQADTVYPYANCVSLSTDGSFLIGPGDVTTLNIKVTDQFGVGLLGVAVIVSIASGDSLSILDPLDGQVVTDANGKASVDYISGSNYTGVTVVRARASGGSINTGSIYVWDQLRLISSVSESNSLRVYQKYADGEFSIYSYIIRQIINEIEVESSIFSKSYFTNPGGDWINPSSYASQVAVYLPHIPVGLYDGPQESFSVGMAPVLQPNDYGGPSMPIRQVLNFDSLYGVQQVGDFLSYNDRLRQIEEASNTLQLSQLKMSLHTSWVDGVAQTELFTDTEINQFIFVEDAIPKFWSGKNPVNTDIWIRLRPFSFGLNQDTLKFYMREISYAGDTGYLDMGSYLTITTYDAGSGLTGLDVTCNPPSDFHYNGIVYIKIEVYDLAPEPNFIWVYYWFAITPDYRFPYLDNLNPAREQENIPVDSEIYFEVKDYGVGVDISTFEMTVNSILVAPDITKINDNFYSVTYTPTTNFGYDKTVTVNVKVADLSEYSNYLNDGYRFYTLESSEVWFAEAYPARCKRGFSPYSSVRFLVLGGGDGVDRSTIRVQILEKEKTNEVSIVPVVYRIQ